MNESGILLLSARCAEPLEWFNGSLKAGVSPLLVSGLHRRRTLLGVLEFELKTCRETLSR